MIQKNMVKNIKRRLIIFYEIFKQSNIDGEYFITQKPEFIVMI